MTTTAAPTLADVWCSGRPDVDRVRRVITRCLDDCPPLVVSADEVATALGTVSAALIATS